MLSVRVVESCWEFKIGFVVDTSKTLDQELEGLRLNPSVVSTIHAR